MPRRSVNPNVVVLGGGCGGCESDATHPVAAGADDPERDGARVSPRWRVGRSVPGPCLPRRFRSAEPLHAGLAWAAMDLGRELTAAVMARPA